MQIKEDAELLVLHTHARTHTRTHAHTHTHTATTCPTYSCRSIRADWMTPRFSYEGKMRVHGQVLKPNPLHLHLKVKGTNTSISWADTLTL